MIVTLSCVTSQGGELGQLQSHILSCTHQIMYLKELVFRNVIQEEAKACHEKVQQKPAFH